MSEAGFAHRFLFGGSFTALRAVGVTADRDRRPGSQDVKPAQESRRLAGDRVPVQDLRLTRAVTLSGRALPQALSEFALT